MKKKIFSLLLLMKIFQLVLPCGMLTHTEISHRAFHKFIHTSKKGLDYKSIISENSSFFMAGSPFPDWGYSCHYGNAAEETHWPPFIHSFIDFLNEKYKGDQKRYNQLVSFLFGIESHGIADVLWHWGKDADRTDEQGFLRSMSHMASYCKDEWSNEKNPDCHLIGDAGGDMYLGYRGGIKWLSDFWTVPVKDMQTIYERIQVDSNVQKMTECLVMMYVGWRLEGIASIVALAYFERNAAFLTDDLDMWYNGGLDDIASNAIWQWQNLINLLEDDRKIFKYLDRLKRKNHFSNSKFKKDMKFIMSKILNSENVFEFKELLGISYRLSDEYGDLVFTSNDEIYSKNKNKILLTIAQILFPKNYETILKDVSVEKALKFNSKQSIKKLVSTVPLSYFGKSITYGDFNGDGTPDIAIGAPGFGNYQQGAVYIISNSNYDIEIDYNDPWLYGEQSYSRFGFSLTTVDLNHDGIDDLVVSAPIFGNNGPSEKIEDYYPKDYYGKIYIYYGKIGTGIPKNTQPDAEITTKDTSEIFFNLGYFVNSGDCNNDGFKDLLIGSPYSQQVGNKRGHVAIYTGGMNITYKFIEDADFTLTGKDDFEEFGYSIFCHNNLLLVGAPGARWKGDNDYQASGALYGYDFASKSLTFSIISDKAQARFGASLAMDIINNIIAVGAPSYSVEENVFFNYHNGVVFIFSLEKLQSEITLNQAKTKISSNITRSRFGKTVQFNNRSLIVSATMLSNSVEIVENGAVFIFDDIVRKQGEILLDEANQILENGSNGARFGNSLSFSNTEFAISAPLTVSTDLAGEVILFANN